jgi:hypothetical protein
MDLLAYDLGRVTAHNLGEGLAIEQFNQRLDSGHLYLGASGHIKFVDHIADRKYDIIKRNVNGSYEIVDRAE